MCWQVEQAGHTGVCLGCGITVNISITRSVGYGICCFLFPSPKCSVTDPARRWEDTALQVSPHATASRCYTTGIDSSCFWRRFSRYATALTRGSWRLCATLWLLISMRPCSGVFSFSTTHLVWVSLSGVNIWTELRGADWGTEELFTARMRASYSSHISTPGMSAALFGGGVKAIIPIQLWRKKYVEVLPSPPLMNVYGIKQWVSLLLSLSTCFIRVFRLWVC